MKVRNILIVVGGVTCPLMWSRGEGKGHVAHIAIGHDDKVWSLQPHQQLILQAVD